MGDLARWIEKEIISIEHEEKSGPDKDYDFDDDDEYTHHDLYDDIPF